MNITIIGCGHGGQALAAQLSMRGNSVTIYANPSHPGGLNTIHETGRITLTGKINYTARNINATFKMNQAIESAEIIFLVLPTKAHESTVSDILPHLKNGQVVVCVAANFTSLYLRKILIEHNKTGVIVADISSLPYACRAEQPGVVKIIEIKSKMGLACIPSAHTVSISNKLNPFFPTPLTPYKNCLELGMNITSGLSHPTVALLNAGRIGPEEQDFYFYKQGISQEIANVITQLDKERQIIGGLYKLNTPSYLELMAEFYDDEYKDIYQFFTQSRVHNALKLCPQSLRERYITQDIPYVIVPWYSLGVIAGYESRVMKMLIDLASMLNQADYLSSGRNFIQRFYEFHSNEHLLHYCETGFYLSQQKQVVSC